MNPIAQDLTGWTEQEARGQLLKEIFVIENETTRIRTEDPVERVLRLGRIVGLANHTVLLRRDGTEIAIDDSAAPVYDAKGKLCGVVLVFRDVADRRRAELNMELLAESGTILGEARDAGSIFGNIGASVSKHFADFCIFDLVTPSGAFERVIGQHRHPAMQEVADGLYRFPPSSEEVSAHPTRSALHTGQAVLLREVTDDILQKAAQSAEHLAYFREQLHPRSVIAVPMRAEGRSLGVVTFLRNLLATPFNEADLKLAEELTKRVGLALHYARLREQLRIERARLDAITSARLISAAAEQGLPGVVKCTPLSVNTVCTS